MWVVEVVGITVVSLLSLMGLLVVVGLIARNF
jgi:hypothetical protein